jgi:hypothetical protein
MDLSVVKYQSMIYRRVSCSAWMSFLVVVVDAISDVARGCSCTVGVRLAMS